MLSAEHSDRQPSQLREVAEVPGGQEQIGQLEVRAQDGPDFWGQDPFQIERENHGG